MISMFSNWRRQGEHWIWLNAMAIGLCLVMVFGLIGLIMVRGLAYFWPADVVQYNYLENGQQSYMAGEISETILVDVPHEEAGNTRSRTRIKLKVGNRDLYGIDFRWIWLDQVTATTYPEDLIAIEREEWGNFYGFIQSLNDGTGVSTAGTDYQQLSSKIPLIRDYRARIHEVTSNKINVVNAELEALRLEKLRYAYRQQLTPEKIEELAVRQAQLQSRYQQHEAELLALEHEFSQLGSVRIGTANGTIHTIQLNQIYRIWQPNAMSTLAKIGAYAANVWNFLRENPREANTEGGVFPAIFGTVVMVFLMTIFTTPMGVIAAIYMREYAKQGTVIRLVRICVNNLAGVPSVVYGVFGLGFFVYFIGGNIDTLFYPEALPSPTFGSPGVLWASLTLALLTLPVVIVSAEEGFARIPGSVREGSMAVGATKFETIYKILLPMSTPAIMTGMILAIARAAGEVAPLMLVGVVKLAPDLVIDGVAPFLHLDRKFMHLGFHIYDVGFQSPNVDAATPLVYATAFLLLLVIIVLNIAAIMVRNRLREKYKQLDI